MQSQISPSQVLSAFPCHEPLGGTSFQMPGFMRDAFHNIVLLSPNNNCSVRHHIPGGAEGQACIHKHAAHTGTHTDGGRTQYIHEHSNLQRTVVRGTVRSTDAERNGGRRGGEKRRAYYTVTAGVERRHSSTGIGKSVTASTCTTVSGSSGERALFYSHSFRLHRGNAGRPWERRILIVVIYIDSEVCRNMTLSWSLDFIHFNEV